MAEKKKEAEAAAELMTALFERISTDETNKKGLVITQATYGKFSEEEIDEGNIKFFSPLLSTNFKSSIFYLNCVDLT